MTGSPGRSGLQVHRVAGTILAAAGLVALGLALGFPLGSAEEPGPAYYPTILAVLLAVLGAMLVVFDGPSRRLAAVDLWERGRPLLMIGVLAAAATLVEVLGFRITLILFLLFLLVVVERLHVLIAIAIAVVLPVATFALLHGVLKINLPVGALGF